MTDWDANSGGFFDGENAKFIFIGAIERREKQGC